MSYEDFCRCDSDELASIFNAFSEARAEQNRAEWERMRVLATICIQPHVRRKITPKRLLPLPWDNDKKRAAAEKATAENLSPGEKLKRFERLVNG